MKNKQNSVYDGNYGRSEKGITFHRKSCHDGHCAKKFCTDSPLLKNGFIFLTGQTVVPERIILPNGVVRPCSLNTAKLLCLLLSKTDEALPRQSIVDYIWPEGAVSGSSLAVHVSKLRNVLKGTQFRIITLRGIGYSLERLPDIQCFDDKNTALIYG